MRLIYAAAPWARYLASSAPSSSVWDCPILRWQSAAAKLQRHATHSTGRIPAMSLPCPCIPRTRVPRSWPCCRGVEEPLRVSALSLREATSASRLIGGDSIGERRWADLEMDDQRLHALTPLLVPRRPITARDPKAAPLPTRGGVIDSTVDTLGVESQRIGNAQRDEAALHQRVHAVKEIARRDRHVCPQPQRVVLIHPGVITRLDAHLRQVGEARSRQAMERPACGARVARRSRPVERPPALAPIELPQVSAREGYPHHAVAIDISAAHAEAGRRYIVDLAQAAARIEANDGAGITKRDRAPDAAIRRIRHDGVKADGETLVPLGTRRLTGFHPRIELAVAVGVEHQGSPTLRSCRIAGQIEFLGVEPAHDLVTAAGPERVARIFGELQVMRAEAGVNESIFTALRLIHRELPLRRVDRKRHGGRMSRAFFAERWIVGRANSRGVPDPPGTILHRIVGIRPAVPDPLLAPVRRGPQHRVIVGRRRIGIAHRRAEGGGAVLYRITPRKLIAAEFRGAVQQAIGVDRGIAAIRSREIMQIRLAIRPVAHRRDDIAFDAARSRGWAQGQFTRGDTDGRSRK